MSKKIVHKSYKFATFMAISLMIIFPAHLVSAQSELESNNYKILDPTTDSGGGATDSQSGNFSLLSSTGNPTADARLESGNYALGSGFPNGIQANVPLITCAETDTTAATPSLCTQLPNSNGMQGECGTPGCYDRAKVELDPQENPIDALFLVEITDTDTNTVYYVQSDNTIDTVYDIADYRTVCEFQGRDDRETNCDDPSDAAWDESLQSSNVYGLTPDTNYSVRARALNGDITETQYSPAQTMSTVLPSLGLDIDIGTTSTVDNPSPYSVDLGQLTTTSPTTAPNQIWLDMNTNASNGMNTFVRSENGGLQDGASSIPSQTEDLAVDTDGGYGIKIDTYTEASLGPIIAANYETVGAEEVEALLTTEQLIFETNTSGTNVGPLTDGRASIFVKAKSAVSVDTGDYTDTISFSMIGNF